MLMSMSMSSSRRWTSASGTDLPARSPLPTAALSPFRQSSRRSCPPTHPYTSAAAASPAHTLWPSSKNKSKKAAVASPSPLSSASLSTSSQTTLADHLNSHTLHSAPTQPQPQLLSRQRCCIELPRFANAEAEAKKIGKGSNKGVSEIGRSMRFLAQGKPAGVTLTPGCVVPADLPKLGSSVDATFGVLSTESERSDASRTSTPRPVPKSPSPLIPRTSSVRLLGSSNTQWALSPGRWSGSPLKTFETMPEVKCKKGLISLGWGSLFNRRKLVHTATATATAAAVLTSSPTSRAASSGGGEEAIHKMRMMHGRLLQWRFANAKADAVRTSKLAVVELASMSTWARLSELRGKVSRKRRQLRKEKLNLKLNTILSSQMKDLESWGLFEGKHSSALASTGDYFRAAVCRIPLTNGAEVSLQSLESMLGQVMELLLVSKTIVRSFTPVARDAAALISELVLVVNDEQAFFQQCLELLGQASALQIEEQSLRCHLVQWLK